MSKYDLRELLKSPQKRIARALLLEQVLPSSFIEGAQFDHLQICVSEWQSGIFLDTQSQYFESENSKFIGCYFENVQWTRATLRNTQFSHCVFKNCTFNLENISEMELNFCVIENSSFNNTEAKVTWNECVLRNPEIKPKSVTPTAAVPSPKPEPAADLSRFKILEI